MRMFPMLAARFAPFCMALAVLVAAPHQALADWKYTRWGMTAAQTVAASRGALHEVPFAWRNTRANLACTVRGAHSSVAGPLEADLCFDAHGGLRLVALTRPRCTAAELRQLRADLTRHFGEPAASSNEVYTSWRYEAVGSTVVLEDDTRMILGSCSVVHASEAPPDGFFAPPRGPGDPFMNGPRPAPRGTGQWRPG